MYILKKEHKKNIKPPKPLSQKQLRKEMDELLSYYGLTREQAENMADIEEVRKMLNKLAPLNDDLIEMRNE
jgi:hypothetical protein